MSKVRGATFLLNRNGRYYFRRPIPSELRGEFQGRAEFKVSLRTSDKSAARAKVERLTLDTTQQIEAARRKLMPRVVRDDLTDAEITAICDRHHAKLLGDDEDWRIEGLTRDTVTADKLGIDRAREALNEPGLPEEGVLQHIDELLAAEGVALRHDSRAFKRLAYFFTQATKLALEAFEARHAGKVVTTPKVEARSLLVVSAVFEKWMAMGGIRGEARSKSVDEARKSLDALIALHGDLPASALTKQHGIALRDSFRAKGNAPGTIRKKIGLINAVLAFAVREDYIPAHPFKGVQLPRGRKAQRRGFTVPELQTLFAHPVFTSGRRGDASTADALFWVPLMSLYGGARLEELGQLRVVDFHEDPDHGWYYSINDNDRIGGMHVKNAASVRRVPVHPELERLGLLCYADARRRAGDAGLFPSLTLRKSGQRTQALSTAFGRMMDDVGLTDPLLVFHSFRHTFMTLAREAEIGGDVVREIAGHEGKRGVHLDYGTFPVSALVSAMRRIKVRGLDLSAVRFPCMGDYVKSPLRPL